MSTHQPFARRPHRSGRTILELSVALSVMAGITFESVKVEQRAAAFIQRQSCLTFADHIRTAELQYIAERDQAVSLALNPPAAAEADSPLDATLEGWNSLERLPSGSAPGRFRAHRTRTGFVVRGTCAGAGKDGTIEVIASERTRPAFLQVSDDALALGEAELAGDAR